MTDEDLLISWTACDTCPEDAIANFRRKGSNRKWRLFAVACCRRVEHLLSDKRFRRAIEVAEKHADGAVADSTLLKAFRAADKAFDRLAETPGLKATSPLRCAAAAVNWCAISTNGKVAELGCHAAFQARHATKKPHAEAYEQAYLLQDVLGGKKPAVKLDPEWRTSTVVALARGIYAERAFDRMPILADALQDAGCENKRILSHCRNARQVHVRGCWVVDLILGKE
jgi:hypothetical protein